MELTKTPDVPMPPRRFVPDGFEPKLNAIKALADRLEERPLDSPDALRGWIYDWGELSSFVLSELMRRTTAMNRDTTDADLRERCDDYRNNVWPAWQVTTDRLNRRYLESPHRGDLGAEFEVFDRNLANDAVIFREENTQIVAQEGELSAQWQELQGAITIELFGETLTAQQAGVFMTDKDRAKRKQVFDALLERREQDVDAIDSLYDTIVGLRTQRGKNAGFDGYLGLGFRERRRFDYGPDDCYRFHDAIEKVAVPAASRVRERRRQALGLDTLRAYDIEVPLADDEPPQLFSDQDGLVDLTQRFFQAVDPSFHSDFDVLVRNGMLDLMSRPGKAPGAYNCAIPDIGIPFIFGNSVGLPRDVRTMLHEGGHAFHTLATREFSVREYQRAPAEFCEVASMSMELFGLERMEEILGKEVTEELAREQLEHSLLGLCRIAAVDAFQLWIYEHPEHTRGERGARFAELWKRFGPWIDWSGYEEQLGSFWQRIPHLFTHPLYMVDYAIAQVGALQMWRNARRDHDAAVEAYRRALALGGSRPLPELFEAAGLRFAMDEETLGELVPDLMERIGA